LSVITNIALPQGKNPYSVSRIIFVLITEIDNSLFFSRAGYGEKAVVLSGSERLSASFGGVFSKRRMSLAVPFCDLSVMIVILQDAKADFAKLCFWRELLPEASD